MGGTAERMALLVGTAEVTSVLPAVVRALMTLPIWGRVRLLLRSDCTTCRGWEGIGTLARPAPIMSMICSFPSDKLTMFCGLLMTVDPATWQTNGEINYYMYNWIKEKRRYHLLQDVEPNMQHAGLQQDMFEHLKLHSDIQELGPVPVVQAGVKASRHSKCLDNSWWKIATVFFVLQILLWLSKGFKVIKQAWTCIAGQRLPSCRISKTLLKQHLKKCQHGGFSEAIKHFNYLPSVPQGMMFIIMFIM